MQDSLTGLSQFRADIDGIDDQIVDLLARRYAVCRQVAHYKLIHDIPVVLTDRIEQVKQRCAERAAAKGVDAGLVTALYTLIIDHTCETERRVQAEAMVPLA